MKKVIIVIFLMMTLSFPVAAAGIVAPAVPDDVEQLMPSDETHWGDGIGDIFKAAFREMQPQVASGLKVSGQILGALLILSLLRNFDFRSKMVVELGAVLAVSCMVLDKSHALILSGAKSIQEISQYGKLLLPAMTAALAAQGGTVSAASMYAATCLFDGILTAVISSVLVPMIYIYTIFAVMNAATGDDLLGKIKTLIKSVMTWFLKMILYIFTGYISLSGIISGGADQTAIKATKLTISSMIPVVGSILSDASETVLVSAGIIKNSLGIYGLLAIIAIAVLPFLSIGIHYLAMKITSSLASVFVTKSIATLLEDLAGAMGLILGMIGSICLIHLISVVCFLKGMS